MLDAAHPAQRGDISIPIAWRKADDVPWNGQVDEAVPLRSPQQQTHVDWAMRAVPVSELPSRSMRHKQS
jgi:hypothetical protein